MPHGALRTWGWTAMHAAGTMHLTMLNATVRGAGCASGLRCFVSRWADVLRVVDASVPTIGNGLGVRIPGVEGSAAQALPDTYSWCGALVHGA